MKYTRIPSLFLIILMIGMFVCFGASIAAAKTVTVGNASGAVGADVNLPITLNDPSGVGGVAFTLNYNPAIFTFKGLSKASPIIDDGSTYLVEGQYVVTEEQKPAVAQTLFYQHNDTGGQILIAAASATALTNGALFNATFNIKAGSGDYPIGIARSIIENAAAGYTEPTFLPVLVGMPATDPVDGYYPTPTFPATLVNGKISVTALGYKISGTATYEGGTAADGATVTLRKKTATGAFVLDGQTTVASGAYSFNNKQNGTYKVSVASNNPNFGNFESAEFTVSGANATQNAILPSINVRVTGTVTVNSATGLEGLKVKITKDGATVGIYAVNADGSFDIGPLPSGTYVAKAVYGSLESAALTLGAATDWTPTLYSIGGTISGTGDATATITAVSAAGKIQKTVTAGAGGVYTIANLVPANDYIVSAVATGFPVMYYDGQAAITDHDAVDISGGNAPAVNFDYSASTQATIAGAVTDLSTGVPDIGVFAFDVNTFALTSVLTDEAGAYTITVAPGSYEVFVIKSTGKIFYYADGGSTQNESAATLLTVAATNSLTGKDIDITECDKTLTGKVTYERADGDPVEGAMVTAESADGESSAIDITGQDGAYTLTGLCDGVSYTVTMTPLVGSFAVQEATITAGSDTEKNFVIDTGHELTGTVTDAADSSKVPSTMIYLTDQETGLLVGGRMYFSDANGAYSIGDIATGIYSLEASHPAYSMYSASDLSIWQDTTKDIALVKGAHFKGTVLDGSNSNAPLAGATIIVTRAGGTPLYKITNSSGQYELYGLDATKSDYIVMAQKKGYERSFKIAQQPSTAGTTVDFTLNLPAAVCALSGAITSGCGDKPALEGAIVVVSSTSKDFFATDDTSSSGAYSFAGLPQATDYRFVVIPGSGLQTYVETNVSLSAATVTKDVEISCGQDISGTVTGKGTGAITVYLFTEANAFVDEVTAGTGGTYTFKGLSAGNYKVLAVEAGNTAKWYDGQALIANATTVAAGTSSVDINLQ